MASIHREGQQRDGTGALDGLAQLTLMLGAVAAHPAGQDLAALVGEAAQTVDVLVVDVLDLIHTEAAHLPAGATASPGRGFLSPRSSDMGLPPYVQALKRQFVGFHSGETAARGRNARSIGRSGTHRLSIGTAR